MSFSPPDDGAGTGRGRRRRAAPEMTPGQRALALLVRREHSRKELARKLTQRGVDRHEATEAVERMQANGWQSDERFAEQLVRSRASQGHGPLRIKAELATHGLSGEAIQTAMSTGHDGDWLTRACELVERRFGAEVISDRNLQRKAADFLIRRGFSADQVRRASRLESDDSD